MGCRPGSRRWGLEGDVVLDVSSTLGVRLVPRALAARLEDELLLILLVRSDRNRIDRSLHGDGNLLRGSGVDWRHNLRGAHLSICAPAFEKASCSQSNADDEPTRSKSDAPRLLRRSIATTSIVLAACAIR